MVLCNSHPPPAPLALATPMPGGDIPKPPMQDMTCKESVFELINSCKLLKENFPCDSCAESYGPDQPSYVELDAPELNVSRAW